MKKVPYITKTGAHQFKPRMSDREFENATNDGSPGFCLACGREADGVEPDARKYVCESCGAPKVYGLEELLMMGLLTFTNSKAEAV